MFYLPRCGLCICIMVGGGHDRSDEVTDGDKLRTLADWFDARDRENGNSNDGVQRDLRRIAATLDKHESTIEEQQSELRAWRDRFQACGFDGNSIVMSG